MTIGHQVQLPCMDYTELDDILLSFVRGMHNDLASSTLVIGQIRTILLLLCFPGANFHYVSYDI